MAYTVWIGDYHATRIAPHGPPTWETEADGGCGELKMTLMLPASAEHQALVKGTPVKVTLGAYPVYWGRLLDYNRAAGELVAAGEFSRNKLALDAGGNSTRDLGVAITQAIARGWNVSNPNGVGGVAHGDGSDVQTVAELAREVAEQSGQRVGINGRGEFYMTADPTTPSWLLAPNSAALGTTSEGTATALMGRYDTGAGLATATVGDFSGDEEAIGLGDRGVLTAGQATDILNGALTLTRGRAAWVGGMTLADSQITTRGGTPAALADVVAGSMVRIPGVPVLAAGGLWLDEVIGKTRYTAGERSIYLEPVNKAPRSLRDVLAAS